VSRNMKGFEIENEMTGFDFIVCFRSDIGGAPSRINTPVCCKKF